MTARDPGGSSRSDPGESQFALLPTRRFGPYFAVQCLGALNDNVLRNGIVILVTYSAFREQVARPDVFANLLAALFILPFFLFSATAGQLADKYDQAALVRRIRLFEIALMALAAPALLSGQLWALLTLVFFMGLQSALFGPIKYSILPHLVHRDELVGANGLVEGGTYLAIIAGLFIGGMIVTIDGLGPGLLGGVLVAVAVAGDLCSRAIPAIAAAAPSIRIGLNPWRETMRVIGFARGDPSVFLSIMGISWFWSFGMVALAQLPAFTQQALLADAAVANGLLVTFAIGIGAGSLACERLAGHRIELGLVPLGSLGLSVFSIDLFLAVQAPVEPVAGIAGFLARPGAWRIVADLVLIGVSGGFFSVPLYALVQDRSAPQQRSRVIAANNVINAFFMVLAAAAATGALAIGATTAQLFVVLALVNAAVAVYIFSLVPEFVMRFLVWLLVGALYRIRADGLERIPSEGPAVIVANHVSFVDALLIGGCVRRPVRFVMYYRIFQIPILSFIFRTARAIPIAGRREDPDMLERAYEQIDAELEAGHLVCIFPEGQITRDGELNTFRKGIERIIERRPVPVIPVALRGLWGSWFSRKGGAAILKAPRRWRARLHLVVGEPREPDRVTANALEADVRRLLDGA